MQLLTGTYDRDVFMENLTSYAILATLADRSVPKHAKQHMLAMVANHIAVNHDIAHPGTIEFDAVDIQPINGDEGFAWHVEIAWFVLCEEGCGHIAREQTDFTNSMCINHLHEAYAQERADLENDDIKAGIYDN